MIRKKKQLFSDFAVSKGLRSTHQLDIILDIFISTHKHVSVEELYLMFKLNHPAIGRTTVCRNHKLFSDTGLAREIILHDEQTRYERVLTEGHPDHLICTSCNSIIEFENETIERLQEEVASRRGFLMNTHKMEI